MKKRVVKGKQKLTSVGHVVAAGDPPVGGAEEDGDDEDVDAEGAEGDGAAVAAEDEAAQHAARRRADALEDGAEDALQRRGAARRRHHVGERRRRRPVDAQRQSVEQLDGQHVPRVRQQRVAQQPHAHHGQDHRHRLHVAQLLQEPA